MQPEVAVILPWVIGLVFGFVLLSGYRFDKGV